MYIFVLFTDELTFYSLGSIEPHFVGIKKAEIVHMVLKKLLIAALASCVTDVSTENNRDWPGF